MSKIFYRTSGSKILGKAFVIINKDEVFNCDIPQAAISVDLKKTTQKMDELTQARKTGTRVNFSPINIGDMDEAKIDGILKDLEPIWDKTFTNSK